jgi:hypothetical protein
MMVGTTTLMRTRNVSQSVACRVVGMTGVINVAWYPLLSCRLALRGNNMLGHVTNCKYIIRYCKGWCILLSTRICGFTTHWSWDRELYAYRVFRIANPGVPTGRKKTSARGVSHAQSFTFFILLYFIFACIFLSKIQKN